MRWAPQPVPWNDLQSSRSLVRASALWSLISDRTPWLSSSSPVLHKQEQRYREHTEPRGTPLTWGAPDQAVHHARAQKTAAAGSLLRSAPTLTSPQDKSVLQRPPQENPALVACRRGQDRQGLGRSDFLKCANALKHTSINVCGWSPRRRKMKKWSKSHLWKDNGHGFSKTIPCVTSILLI